MNKNIVMKNNKKARLTLLIGATIFSALFSFWMSYDTTEVWPLITIIINLILTFVLTRRYENRSIETERNNGFEEAENDETLDLDSREICLNYSEDDLV